MLTLMFQTLGTPTDEDIVALCGTSSVSESMRGVLRGLGYKAPVPLRSKYPASPEVAIDMLARMLTINPYRRITVEQCLSHPLLAATAGSVTFDHGEPMLFEFEGEKQNKPKLRKVSRADAASLHLGQVLRTFAEEMGGVGLGEWACVL